MALQLTPEQLQAFQQLSQAYQAQQQQCSRVAPDDGRMILNAWAAFWFPLLVLFVGYIVGCASLCLR